LILIDCPRPASLAASMPARRTPESTSSCCEMRRPG
jgi:hypothetical protein